VRDQGQGIPFKDTHSSDLPPLTRPYFLIVHQLWIHQWIIPFLQDPVIPQGPTCNTATLKTKPLTWVLEGHSVSRPQWFCMGI
jgi:hypothetical protein